MSLPVFLILLLIVIIILGHLWTTSREMDSMGWIGGKDYQKFLHRKDQPVPKPGKTRAIPPPPYGPRDMEVEALIVRGKVMKARELLTLRMEEARLAPIGSEKKIAAVSHYIDFLNDPTQITDF